MDSLTQAALGAVVGERVLGKQLGRRAIGWGALLGTLPDLDVLLYPALDPVAELYWHRGFSHSLTGVLVGTPLIAWVLFRWWNRKTVRGAGNVTPLGFRRILCFVFLNFSTHILIDCFTVYGTQLLEPFSNRRFGLNNLFIIDPLFTLPLLLWIGAALLRKKEPGRAPNAAAAGCGLFLTVYTAFSLFAQSAAAHRFERELSAAGIPPTRGMVTAAPFTTLIWRGLYETEDAFWIGYWAINDSDEPLEFRKVPRRLELLDDHRKDRFVQCVLWFSEEFVLVEESAKGGFLLTDLRFVEFWPEDTGGMPRTFFSWQVVPASENGGPVFEPVRSHRRDYGGVFEALASRLRGDRSALFPKEP